MRNVLLFLALGFCLGCFSPAQAQSPLLPSLQKDSSSKTQDSARVDADLAITDTSLSSVLTRLEQYAVQLNKDQAFLKKGYDTAEIHNTLDNLVPMLERWRTNVDQRATAGNIRNLNSIKVAIEQVLRILYKQQDDASAHTQQLVRISEDVAKLRNDSALNRQPRDSVLLSSYHSKIQPLYRKWAATDSSVQAQLKGMGLLQGELASAIFSANEVKEMIDDKILSYQRRFLAQDVNLLWEKSTFADTTTLTRTIANGLAKNVGLSLLYLLTNGWPLILCLLLTIGLYFINRFNLKKLVATNRRDILSNIHFLRRSNLGSVLLIFFMVSPFLLTNPPAGLVQVFWVVVTLMAIWLRRADWPDTYRRMIWIFLGFFVLFTIDSFILESVSAERYLILLLNLGAIVFGWFFYKEVLKDKTRYHSLMDESILIFLVVNVLALVANLSGRFNVARVLANSSVLSISLLLALQIIREVIMESLYLHAETHRETGFSGFLDFSTKSQKYRKFLGVVTFSIWILSFMWSLSFYDRIYEWFRNFLTRERSLGEVSFTYASILTFVGIIWAAVIVEKLVNMVFKTEDSNFPGRKKSKGGSWVLFSKLGIYIVGFLLAMAAAGIPMDKFAIVLGALGVGIGLGLQNIVNNLVSGIILAVEKPMQVGDVIELGTRMGTVREIGFRSSQIVTYDGSVIIVPNGDFISQQLINWTHANNSYRRVDVIIGVPYGTDLEQARTIISQILDTHTEVARFPAPSVLVHQFGNSSVDLRALFWTAEFDKWIALKSDVLLEIYKRFGEAGIEIPFPQQDLHLRSVDPAVASLFRNREGTPPPAPQAPPPSPASQGPPPPPPPQS